jgi:molybdopterin converting factor small subunit
MAITVRFPAMLQPTAGREVVIDEPARDVAALLLALERKIPGISAQLADPIFNFAVNDDMLLHGVRHHPLNDGDVIEIVPTISGGRR